MSLAFLGGTAAEYSDDQHLHRHRLLDAVYSMPRRVASNGIDVDDAAEVAGLLSDTRAPA